MIADTDYDKVNVFATHLEKEIFVEKADQLPLHDQIRK